MSNNQERAEKDVDLELSIMSKVCAHHQITEVFRNLAYRLYCRCIKDCEEQITDHLTLSALCILMTTRFNKEIHLSTVEEITKTYKELGYEVRAKNLLKLLLKLNIPLTFY